MITTFAIHGYRSLRDVRIALSPVTVITGANGSGKSSLYRAMRLMTDVAHGRLVSSLAREGGLQSTLWAGPEEITAAMRRGSVPVQGAARRKEPVSLRFGFSGDEYGYAIDIGLPVGGGPVLGGSYFKQDPQIKVEQLWHGERPGRHNVIAERNGGLVRIRDSEGEWRELYTMLPQWDSMMTHAADPRDAPEVLIVREGMRGWRFYDHFDTGRESPARRPQVGTRTPVLAGDGADLAAAVRTIQENGDDALLAESIADAFDGATLQVDTRGPWFELEMHQPGLLRPLSMSEVSDGTLRYLLLATALLSPRPPALLVLNEPETSLHVDLLAPLGRLILRAAAHAQIVVVSHASALVRAIQEAGDVRIIELAKSLGETIVAEQHVPLWKWPSR